MHVLKLILRPKPVVCVSDDCTDQLYQERRGIQRAYIDGCCCLEHLPGSLILVTAAQAVKVRLGKALGRRAPNRWLAILPAVAQKNCSCRYLCWPEADLAVIHHPPPQNCCVDSSISSWPIPVREAHHGRDAQYYALYSAHKGVPVQREVLVMEP
jgi:hypothetical protein